MNYRYRAMTQDGQKLQGIIDANDERHDCGCVKKGFSCWIFAPKKVRE